MSSPRSILEIETRCFEHKWERIKTYLLGSRVTTIHVALFMIAVSGGAVKCLELMPDSSVHIKFKQRSRVYCVVVESFFNKQKYNVSCQYSYTTGNPSESLNFLLQPVKFLRTSLYSIEKPLPCRYDYRSKLPPIEFYLDATEAEDMLETLANKLTNEIARFVPVVEIPELIASFLTDQEQAVTILQYVMSEK